MWLFGGARMIHQGHLYKVNGSQCIALQTGHIAKFLVLRDVPNIADVPDFVWASYLIAIPQPMKYYGGEVPPSA